MGSEDLLEKEENWVQTEYKDHLVKLESWDQLAYLVNWDRQEGEDPREIQGCQVIQGFPDKPEMMEKGAHLEFPETWAYRVLLDHKASQEIEDIQDLRAATDYQAMRDHLGHQVPRERKDLKVLQGKRGVEVQWVHQVHQDLKVEEDPKEMWAWRARLEYQDRRDQKVQGVILGQWGPLDHLAKMETRVIKVYLENVELKVITELRDHQAQGDHKGQLVKEDQPDQ